MIVYFAGSSRGKRWTKWFFENGGSRLFSYFMIIAPEICFDEEKRFIDFCRFKDMPLKDAIALMGETREKKINKKG